VIARDDPLIKKRHGNTVVIVPVVIELASIKTGSVADRKPMPIARRTIAVG
jgi:hypothetical protein